MTRRRWCRTLSVGGAAAAVAQWPQPLGGANTRADRCIFILLAGGPSHTDTFDWKPGASFPLAYGLVEQGEVSLPRGLFPRVADELESVAFIRCAKAQSTSHEFAQARLCTGCAPLFTSVPGSRRIGSGFPGYARLHASGRERDFERACAEAARLLFLGARFVEITFDGWDHHAGIYDERNLVHMAREFDRGFGRLLARLHGARTLDSTLVVAAGEFGRKGGPLNRRAGRDHSLTHTIVLAGAGIQGPRIIGATDGSGERITNFGWHGNRPVYAEDLAATIYDALGLPATSGTPVRAIWA